MEAVLFEANTRNDLKAFVSLAKKLGICVRYVKNHDIFSSQNRCKSINRAKELDIINKNADYLNSEAQDVLSYQAW